VALAKISIKHIVRQATKPTKRMVASGCSEVFRQTLRRFRPRLATSKRTTTQLPSLRMSAPLALTHDHPTTEPRQRIGIMDTVSPEYRLEKAGAGAGGFTWGEWCINDRHALMMHRPTRAVFLIYLAADADPVLPSIYQLRACLSHVCDGQPVPDGLSVLGEHAVNAYACMTERLEFIEWQKPLR
jgi:hypothetical protein